MCYPKIIKYKKYQPKLNTEKYKDIKKRISISLNGSDGTILNLTIPQVLMMEEPFIYMVIKMKFLCIIIIKVNVF